MSYRPVIKGGEGKALNYYEFVLDSASDVASLPTSTTPDEIGVRAAPGSVAYTANLAHTYILSPSDTWQEVE